ncbi:FctA domain-containing protein [Olsenella sp. kh2p3]|uniref:Spy0128 family protein n=1 Tax=Olsenella sp. kh2p3 TaxID=1797112 RepID=UPI000916A9BF|nr:FctA domain-containing protein [Olsenella sp. kh2p3]SFX63637.1 pilin isopeptide linkage domain-containing protein [Olsenella sp. kh2p3]
MKVARKLWTWALALVATFAVVLGLSTVAMAAAGETPPHTKNITDNQDGTYTISLDIVGESEKQPNNVNVIVVFDRSGSMANPNNTNQRLNAAKTAVNNLARSLFAYNTTDAPNTVQMALVSFSTNATITRQPTTSYQQFSQSVNGLTASGGTNWEAALEQAERINFGDDDQTFVIFVSDGNPTFRDTRITTDYLPRNDNPNWSNSDWTTYRSDNYYYNSQGVYGLGSDNPNQDNYSPISMQRCYDAALPEARAIVQAVGADHFYTIGAYGDVSRMQTLTTEAGAPAGNFYNANDTAALNQAMADILNKIETLGFADAEIDDGTTSQVTTTSGEVANLLVVDESSYKYYRSGGSYGSMQTWTDAPAAHLVDGTVKWDLSSVGVLENDVKYTVTFDCYPSQTTYDIIAQLKNDDLKYSDLDPEIQKYIVDNGGGSYSLRTNTNAGIAWDDTRDDAGPQTSSYTNPDPVRTDAVPMLTVAKEWEGGSADVTALPLTVLMDEKDFHTAALSTNNSWTAEFYISTGLIKDGQVLAGAKGHDFSFAELDDSQYHWELEAPTVRPMLIDGGKNNDGKPNILVKVDADHPAPSGAATYEIDGATYYVDTAASSLTATNHRRSNLNLTKAVTGEDAPQTATFPFTLTVNNSKAPATEPTDDPDHNSDYWVWFSIYDTKAGATVTDATVSGAIGPNADGYYYAPSGTAISVQMKNGWNLRFINLPSGTTYTFVEGALADGFAFSKSELTQGEDSTFSGAQTTKGTIENAETSYYVTYTNDYQLTDLEITKVWEDNDNQDGIRLTAEELAAKLTLSPAVEGKTPTVVENEDGTYTITYTGLPRFNNGEEVTYTVTESAIDGYTTTGSPAKDHGTITNTHTPEATSLTVKKVWEDQDNEYKTRPGSIQVQLLADGEASGDPVTLNEDNQWAYTWDDLDVYAGGKEIAYTVDEVEVDNYATTVGDLTKTDTGYEITITNSNVTVDTSADFFHKTVETGNPTKEAEFSFTLSAEDGTPMPANTTGTVKYLPGKTGDMDVDFGTITYTEAGTYTYTITEGTLPAGWTATPESKTATVTVVVSKGDDGKLSAKVTEGSITNNYAASGSVELEAKKALSGAEWPEGKTLTFTLAGEGGTLPETTTATLTAPGTATFDAITYTEADAGKTYTYTITEDGFGDGWTADPADGISVSVEVTDNGDGTLSAKATYTPENKTITNTYKATGTIELEATKAIAGAAWPEGGSVVFTLSGEGGTLPETKTVTLTEPGKATFDAITYTEADAGKTYTYTISETTGLGTGWTKSADITATVTVTDNGDGTIGTSVEYTNNDTITNTYKADGTAEITVTKAVAGAAWPQGEDGPKTLTLTLAADEGTPMPETTTATLTATGSVTFGPINYTEADAGKTYTYTVSEDGFGDGWTSSGDITVTVKVTDQGDGKLSTEVSYSPSATITNTYKATGSVDLSAKKVLTGREWADVDTYTFTLYGNDGSKIEDVTVTAENKDNVAFSTINYTEADAGKTYTYTISETGTLPANVTKSADVTAKVTITDNGDGTLATSVVYTPEDQTIINTYVPTSVNASITVKKTIDEYIEGSDKTFNFTMTPIDGAPMPEGKTELTASITTEDGKGSVTLDPITYTAAGTYQYKVVEKDEATAGWTYDTKEYTVTVTVTDDPATGKLSAEVTYGGEATAVDVHNLFEEESTSVKLHVDKVIDDQSDSAEDATFTFVLTPGEGAPGETQTIEITTNGLKGGADFAPIEFTESGTFNYTIQETGTAPSGWTYDTKAYPVVITVSDNFETAILESATTIDGETATSLTITNVYKAGSTKSSLQVTKAIEDTSESAPDVTFEFTLATTDGSPMPDPATATVTGAGTATFGEVEYTKAGEYHYTITETKGGDAGWTNDTTTYPVVVTVTDNGGQLVATAAYGEKSETSLTVTNIYDPEDAKATPKALKTIDDQSNSAPSETFTFQLIDSKGNVVETKTRENGGPVEFTELTFAKVGTYEYTIKEVAGSTKGYTYDTADHSVTIKVEDKGDGNLEATITYADGEQATIKNVYKAEPVEVKLEGEKVLEGGKKLEAGEFTFELLDNDGNKVDGTFTNDADGNIDFGTYTFEKAGTYTYTAKEAKGDNEHMTYDSGEHTFVITVTDEGGTLKAEVTSDDGAKAKFTNTYTPEPVSIDPPVQKVITGDKPAIPATFTFQMKAITEGAPMPAGSADGIKSMQITGAGSKEFGEIVYTEPGEWVYEISELKGNAEGYTYDTTVYTLTVKVTQNDDGTLTKTETIKGGDAIVFTNKYEAPKTPKTGDTTLQVGPLFLAGAVITGIAAFGARRRED